MFSLLHCQRKSEVDRTQPSRKVCVCIEMQNHSATNCGCRDHPRLRLKRPRCQRRCIANQIALATADTLVTSFFLCGCTRHPIRLRPRLRFYAFDWSFLCFLAVAFSSSFTASRHDLLTGFASFVFSTTSKNQFLASFQRMNVGQERHSKKLCTIQRVQSNNG